MMKVKEVYVSVENSDFIVVSPPISGVLRSLNKLFDKKIKMIPMHHERELNIH